MSLEIMGVRRSRSTLERHTRRLHVLPLALTVAAVIAPVSEAATRFVYHSTVRDVCRMTGTVHVDD
jgi:hypothetical protein